MDHPDSTNGFTAFTDPSPPGLVGWIVLYMGWGGGGGFSLIGYAFISYTKLFGSYLCLEAWGCGYINLFSTKFFLTPNN